MNGTTNVEPDYKIDMTFPLVGKDDKVNVPEGNSKKVCKSPKKRKKDGVVIIPAYDGGRPKEVKEEQEK